MNPTQIARKIEHLKQQHAELGPIHPGSLMRAVQRLRQAGLSL